MSRLSRRWAREDDVEAEAPVEIEDTDLPNNEMSDASDELSEINAGDSIGNEMLDTMEESENLESVLKNAVDNNEPISEVTAGAITIQTESIQRRLGLSRNNYSITRESFDKAKDGRQAARIAHEGIMDIISKGIQSVKSFFSKIIEKIIIFVDKISNLGTLLIKRAKGFKAKLSKLEDEASKALNGTDNPTIDPKDFPISVVKIKYFFGAGSTVNIGSVMKVMKKTSLLIDTGADIADKSIEIIDSFDISRATEYSKELLNIIPGEANAKIVEEYSGEDKFSNPKVITGLANGVVIGAYTVDITIDGKQVPITRFIGQRSKIPNHSEIVTAKIPVINKDRMEEILDIVIEMGSKLESTTYIRKKVGKLSTLVNTAFAKGTKEDAENKKKRLKEEAKSKKDTAPSTESMYLRKRFSVESDEPSPSVDEESKPIRPETSDLRVLKSVTSAISSFSYLSFFVGFDTCDRALDYVWRSMYYYKTIKNN